MIKLIWIFSILTGITKGLTNMYISLLFNDVDMGVVKSSYLVVVCLTLFNNVNKGVVK